MPNGSPDWEKRKRPKLEEFFKTISNVLVDFAKNHNLLIEKYFHQTPTWTFMFQHPKGGGAQIQVEKIGDNSVLLWSSWWIDDFDNQTRWWKYVKGESCTLDDNKLRDALEQIFKQLISWKKEDLKPVKSKYYRWGKQRDKEEFEGQIKEYPVPKIE